MATSTATPAKKTINTWDELVSLPRDEVIEFTVEYITVGRVQVNDFNRRLRALTVVDEAHITFDVTRNWRRNVYTNFRIEAEAGVIANFVFYLTHANR